MEMVPRTHQRRQHQRQVNCHEATNDSERISVQVALSSSDFKAKALPLHLNLTHTPPTVQKENDVEVEVAEANTTAGDIGSIGNLTLVPNIFNTGSYGWKGSKHITVELQDGEAGPGGGKEKVQVMLTYVPILLSPFRF